ncbi:MAG TPA: IS1634 family transposase [Mycobacterium sp.]|nr:IS1634 family transposase [Mycobacterium sp.]
MASPRHSGVYVESPSRTYQAKDGSTRTYRTHLLRRSYREAGKVKKETLANLSALPDTAITALKASLSGSVLVDAGDMFEIERSLPHGHVAAAHVMASRLGLKNLLGPDCPERDLAYGLIIARAVAPASKLATTRWWADTTLGADLGIDAATTDEVYAAMDWLLSRQDAIENRLAARHLEAGGLTLFDLSSAWLEGHSCPLGAFGHSRDGKKNREQIEFGMITSRAGIPVAVRVFAGNTSDSVAFGEIIPVVRNKFGLDEVILVGDRGSVTKVRIGQLKALPGAGWITALRAPQVAALARDDGPLQMSLFDTQNFAEIIDARYPGERLICCRNPALAAQRAAKRESLLATTETELEKIAAQVAAGRLKEVGKIGIKVGKVINKRKVGKHFITDITDGGLSWRRDEEKIAAEAELDGIYVIRTSAAEEKLGAAETVGAYKELGNLERDFWSMKTEDIDLRPIYHYLENRVRGHVFLCMLATHLTWHLRQALAPLTFTDNQKPAREDPVIPARRSATATAKDTAKITPDKLPVRGYQELVAHLATLTRNTVSFAGKRFEKLSTPTPEQRRVFDLLGKPIPLRLDAA